MREILFEDYFDSYIPGNVTVTIGVGLLCNHQTQNENEFISNVWEKYVSNKRGKRVIASKSS